MEIEKNVSKILEIKNNDASLQRQKGICLMTTQTGRFI
jgi:hypothetical protein